MTYPTLLWQYNMILWHIILRYEQRIYRWQTVKRIELMNWWHCLKGKKQNNQIQTIRTRKPEHLMMPPLRCPSSGAHTMTPVHTGRAAGALLILFAPSPQTESTTVLTPKHINQVLKLSHLVYIHCIYMYTVYCIYYCYSTALWAGLDQWLSTWGFPVVFEYPKCVDIM